MSKSTRPAPDTSKTTSIQLRHKITALLHDSGKSLADLAGSTPYTLQELQQLLNSPEHITVTDLCVLAGAFSVPVSTLLEPAHEKPKVLHWVYTDEHQTKWALCHKFFYQDAEAWQQDQRALKALEARNRSFIDCPACVIEKQRLGL